MSSFEDFKIKKQLKNALSDLGYENATPIQEEAYSPILAGSDFVGIAQTGTGKTFAYLLPILQDLKYSEELHPRVLIMAPTRELVIQIVDQIEKLAPYITLRTLGVYGGVNMHPQQVAIAQGLDILVGTPRRLYDLTLSNVLKLKSIKKLVIDEVDIMLDFGFKTQLNNIFDHLPTKRQNLLFSATMTTYVDQLTKEFLVNPVEKTVSISGTPLDTISQEAYPAPNFYTKASLLNHLLEDKEVHEKVLIFTGTRVSADRLKETLNFESETSVIHSGKEQNQRIRAIDEFEEGKSRILIATDVISRGIDIDKISTVVSFDTPFYPENYIHRIGRTGRAGEEGRSILLFTVKEQELKDAIEKLMNYRIPTRDFPAGVERISQLTPEEQDKPEEEPEAVLEKESEEKGAAFHEKSAKNRKTQGEKKSYAQKVKEKYKKPIRRGDKIQNRKKKKRRR